MRKVILVVALLLVSIQPTRAATANQTVIVDLNSSQGPVTYRAAGYLGSDITDSLPSTTMFTTYWQPLKLQLFSWIRPHQTQGRYTFPGLSRAKALNAYYQVKIYHDPGDMSQGIESPWGREVTAIAQAATAENYPKIQLDILNEPDWTGYWPGTGNLSDPRILQAWRIAYDAARAVNPNLQLVGLNVSANNISWIKNTFLTTMKAENRLPDILSWHEINTPINQIANHVADMRTFLAQNNMSAVKDISINEYNYSNSHLSAGKSLQFISQLERAKVQSASRACWEEVSGGNYDCAPHINGLLTLQGSPRSNWWVYKKYADMTGTLVVTTDPSTYASLASKDTENSRYNILIASIGTETLLNVVVNHTPAATYAIQIEKIPNSGSSALSNPTSVSSYQATPSSGLLEIPISGITQESVYSITLTATSSSQPSPIPSPSVPTIMGDTNGDGHVTIYDYNDVVSHYGTNWPAGDFNRSGLVDIVDYNTVITNFGR